MRLLLLLLLISVPGLHAYSQDLASKAFLTNFFAKSTRLVYMDKLGDYEIKRMEKALSKDTLYNVFDTDLKEPISRLVLTKEERSHIQHELAQQATLIWPNQLVEHGERLTEAAIDSIERTRGWLYFNEHYGARLYTFSNPIFIRNRSLCIFYAGYTCGSRCGEGKLMIYKKQNDTWVPWMELYRWVS